MPQFLSPPVFTSSDVRTGGFLLCLVLLAGGNAVAQENTYTRYFLDRPPTAEELRQFPDIKEPITVVRVRIITMAALGPRHHKREVDHFGASLSELDKEGASMSQAKPQLSVLFGTRADKGLMRPSAPDLKCPEYFVTVVASSDGEKRLLPFPGTAAEYDRWQELIREHMRRNSGPGRNAPRYAEREQGCWR